MKAEYLNKIIKDKKINVEHYDSVAAFINEAFTFVIVSFFETEVLAGRQRRCNEKVIKLSVASIQKRFEYPEDYETPSMRIKDILNQ